MGLTYDTYKAHIALLAVVDPDDVNFNALLPEMIEYASLRIARDLDLMSTSVSLSTNMKLTVGDRRFLFFPPTGQTFVVAEQLNLILPVGEVNPDNGDRIPLTPVTKEFLDVVYGSSQSKNLGQPKYFAPFNETLFLLGPVPDQVYYVEVVGTIRADILNATTHTMTFISLNLPDLLIMASMVYLSGYQRNFGRQSDDPQMAVSYEAQYQTLLKGAMGEEARKKFEAAAWSSQSPATQASPTRG